MEDLFVERNQKKKKTIRERAQVEPEGERDAYYRLPAKPSIGVPRLTNGRV